MSKFQIRYVDCVWDKCKNLQKINTIELFFYVNTEDEFVIDYNFHSLDFDLWVQILEVHKEENSDARLFNSENEEIVSDPINSGNTYFAFSLRSKNFNLYRNINLVFFLEHESGWNNMSEMLRQNTWNSPLN